VKGQAQMSPRLMVRASDRSDPWILIITAALVLTGLLLVLDTTYFLSQNRFGDSYRMVTKHGISVLLGVVLMWLLSRVRSDLMQRWARPALVAASLLLVVPLLPGLGVCTKGACRWISLGPLNLQPGEILKLVFVVYLAAALTRKSDKLGDWRFGIAPTLVVMAVICSVLLLQPDFGTAALIGILGVVLMFLAGVPSLQLGGLGLLMGGAVVAAVRHAPYRLNRLLCFLDPSKDPQGACYQIRQSFNTFGSGELSGTGLGSSLMKTGLLPEAHTDFVFSVIGEEAGFIGAMVLLLCFATLAYRGFRVAHRHPDMFGQMLAAGLTLLISLQALINMGVVLGLLPTKGLVLPFVSYGGSAMLVFMAAVGMLMSLSRELRER